MSAFLMSNKTISKLAYALSGEETDIKELSSEYEKPEVLALDLYRLNVKALSERYGKDEAEKWGAFEFIKTDEFNESNKDLAQYYRSLRCFLYQCSEGNVPKTKLFETLDKLSDIIAHRIASNWSDELGAEWD